MRARRARAGDAAAIHRLITHYAGQGLLLSRSEKEVREHVDRFLILVERDQLVGCVALEPYGAELAEIRSLAVDPGIRGRGAGTRLLQFALAEARRRKIARVFAVTHLPDFFVLQGFETASRQTIPEKIARDCLSCPKARRCRLVAVVAAICAEHAALSVLAASANSVPAA